MARRYLEAGRRDGGLCRVLVDRMSIALLLRYWHVVALAAFVAFGAFEWRAHNAAEVEKGRAMERARVADSTLKVINQRLAKVETTYVRDTIRLTKTIAKTQTLRDTLLVHLTDTVMVKQFIAQTDSTVHACTEVANTCADKLRLKDAAIAMLNQQLHTRDALVDIKYWYSDRFTVGPYVGIDQHGKGSIGVAAQFAVFRFP